MRISNTNLDMSNEMKLTLRDAEIITLYKIGISVPRIAKDIGLGRTRIYEILDIHGIKRRTGKEYLPKSAGREKEMIEYYGLGYSAFNTGREFGICESTVLYVLRKNNVAVRKCGTADWTKHPNWKGGLSKTNAYMAAKNRKYRAARKEVDPLFKATCAMRARISTFFRRGRLGKSGKIRKHKTTVEMLGANFDTALKHIESQFKEGMTWSNYGQKGWHIDHITPLCSAKNQEDLVRLFHYTNLQPLWAKENHKKGGKYAS